jgi:hypothetical protein
MPVVIEHSAHLHRVSARTDVRQSDCRGRHKSGKVDRFICDVVFHAENSHSVRRELRDPDKAPASELETSEAHVVSDGKDREVGVLTQLGRHVLRVIPGQSE